MPSPRIATQTAHAETHQQKLHVGCDAERMIHSMDVSCVLFSEFKVAKFEVER
jgi:hypothetical protein